MKVIGLVSQGIRQEYVCTVGHTELEQFLNLYYGKMKSLNVGDEVNLAKGYNYAQEIGLAMRTTKEFIESSQSVVNAILNGLRFEQYAEKKNETTLQEVQV